MSKRKRRNGYSERISVGFTPEQMRRVEEILRVRARDGKMQHKTDLIRDALNLYLSHQDDIPGTRAAITRKGVERITPRRGAKIWQHSNRKKAPLPCDENLSDIRRKGRKKWKQYSGYHDALWQKQQLIGSRPSSATRSAHAP